MSCHCQGCLDVGLCLDLQCGLVDFIFHDVSRVFVLFHGSFHWDTQAGLEAAFDLLGAYFKPLPLVKQMSPSYLEYASRLVVTSFLHKYIRTGHVQ